jgi:hypothetical protein
LKYSSFEAIIDNQDRHNFIFEENIMSKYLTLGTGALYFSSIIGIGNKKITVRVDEI